jgi:hypothetical protein
LRDTGHKPNEPRDIETLFRLGEGASHQNVFNIVRVDFAARNKISQQLRQAHPDERLSVRLFWQDEMASEHILQ